MHPYLTVIFPSFNRGRILLNTIEKIKSENLNNVSILVLDNASEKYLEEYSQIEEISNTQSWLEYFRHHKNVNFEGNILAGFDLCKTNYLMFVSDEDYPNFKFIANNINIFKKTGAYGVIRPSIGFKETNEFKKPINSCVYPDKSFERGAQAIKQFGLVGNYLSGVIYNKRIFDKYKFKNRLEKNLDIQRFYPHLYLNCIFCGVSKSVFMSEISAFEGVPEVVSDNNVVQNDSSRYAGAYTYGARLDQFIALRDAFSEALHLAKNQNPMDWADVYIALVGKFYHLILLANSRLYHNDNQIHISNISQSFREFATASARLQTPFRTHGEIIIKNINRIEQLFLSKLNIPN